MRWAASGHLTQTLRTARWPRRRHPACRVDRDPRNEEGAAMQLEGSCHCGAVRFRVATLKVRGERHLGRYHELIREPGQRTRRSKAERRFCLRCGSALWLFDPRWPDLVHPHASAIDTPLPKPAEVVE